MWHHSWPHNVGDGVEHFLCKQVPAHHGQLVHWNMATRTIWFKQSIWVHYSSMKLVSNGYWFITFMVHLVHWFHNFSITISMDHSPWSVPSCGSSALSMGAGWPPRVPVVVSVRRGAFPATQRSCQAEDLSLLEEEAVAWAMWAEEEAAASMVTGEAAWNSANLSS